MTGPNTAPTSETSAPESPEAPPGHFLSDQLASDCARFLEEARALARRRAEATAKSPG